MDIQKFINDFLEGNIEFDEFSNIYLNVALDYFSSAIKEVDFDFLDYYIDCYLYFNQIFKSSPNYSYFKKTLKKDFRNIHKPIKFFEKNINKIKSKIVIMDFIYKHILTLNYTLTNYTPKKYSFVFYAYGLVLESTLDMIYGGEVDDFIINNILKLTDIEDEYHKKLKMVELLVDKYFKVNNHIEFDFAYEFSGRWPIDDNKEPMKFKEEKEDKYVFVDGNDRTYYF